MLGEDGRIARVIMPIESNAQYVEPGVLVFAKGGALVASIVRRLNRSSGR